MNGNCGVNEYSNGVNLHTLGAFDRWFEHAGFVNGTFFDSEASGCVDLGDTGACQTPTFPGGEWLGRGDGYDTSTIGNVTIEWLDKIAKEEPERPWAVVRTASPASSRLPTAEGCCCCTVFRAARAAFARHAGIVVRVGHRVRRGRGS